MQYHHIYHAGNFADVFKHCILIMLIESLCKKDKPIFYLDTHAGIGRYDLTSEMAKKTYEYKSGIARLYNHGNIPDIIKAYLKIVRSVNQPNPDRLHYYPGSPLIIHNYLRPQDRMLLVELHSEDVKILKQEFLNQPQVAIHNTNGYQSIKAFLPPKQGRGLILIDPAFEDTQELANIISALKTAKQRFPTGVYAIWHPIKDSSITKDFYYELENIGFKNVLATEFSITSPKSNETHLTSCGMIIINPPWQIDQKLSPLLTTLVKTLAEEDNASFNIKWLTGLH